MARVLGVDVGARCGLGLLGGEEGPRSGSYQFVERWSPFGPQAAQWERRLREELADMRPDHIGIAEQFVREGDTPRNLIPMYWAFGTVLKVAAEIGAVVHWVRESQARLLLLGARNMPQTSEALKLAVNLACKNRNWPCCDHNASDALCIAAAVVERINPDAPHQTAPLFVAAATPYPGRRKKRRRK